MDDAFLHWFAGFVDGEGSFKIQVRNKGSTHTPSFSLVVRDDDAEIIEHIHRELGIGGIYRYLYPSRRQDNYRRGGRVELHASNKADLLKLVEILDHHPLRAKKSKDYQVWREAVLLWANREGHRGKGLRQPHPIQEKLAALKQEMEQGRHYSGAVR